MTDRPKRLSDTARGLLTMAATRNDHLVPLPRLPVAAARQVIRSMLTVELVEEVPAPIKDATFAWRTGEDGGVLMLRATGLGLGRIADSAAKVAPEGAREPPAGTGGSGTVTALATIGPASLADATDQPAPTPPPAPRMAHTAAGQTRRLGTLHQAAQTLLDAWDGRTERLDDLAGAIAALSPTLAASGAARASTRASQPPAPKQAPVLAMLAHDEGFSGPAIAEAMGWAPHIVRGFLARLAKKGITVEVLERVRQGRAQQDRGEGQLLRL